MKEHPIEGLMLTAMESIRSMIDINTIIGEPMEIAENITIIPISKVGFAMAAGGSEFKEETPEIYSKKQNADEEVQYQLPFGGGAGVGASITPVAFIVVQLDSVKVMPVEHANCVDKILDYIPDLIKKLGNVMDTKIKNKEEQTNRIFERIKRDCDN